MAAVAQTITATLAELQQFAGNRAEDSIYPRARVIFREAGNVNLKLAGNTNELTIRFVLPPNFAYTLDEFHVGIGSNATIDADNYSNLAIGDFRFTDGQTRDAMISITAPGDTPQTATGIHKIYSIDQANRFSQVFHNAQGASCEFLTFYNDTDGTNNTDALTAQIYASFLQYDIRQVEFVVVNAPQPVSLR